MHIFHLISNHLESNNTISDAQFGFRPRYLTESALLSVTNSWFSALDLNNSVCAIFLDLKVFDLVPYKPLLNCLIDLNLPSHLIHWIDSYLSNRMQQVKISNVCTSSCKVTSGVPQGSILGPLLFIIYINNITKLNLSPHSSLILYTDNILYFQTISSSDCFLNIQNDLDIISEWVSSHHLYNYKYQ